MAPRQSAVNITFKPRDFQKPNRIIMEISIDFNLKLNCTKDRNPKPETVKAKWHQESSMKAKFKFSKSPTV